MPSEKLETIAQRHGLLAVYLFGSQAEKGLACLQGGESKADVASDLDVAVVFDCPLENDLTSYGELYLELSMLFEPFDLDLVFAHEHDPLFQYEIIKGIRIYHRPDSARCDDYEEFVMRMAEDLSYKKKIMLTEIMEAIEDGYFRLEYDANN